MTNETYDVSGYYAYHYTFLDDLNFIRDPKEIAELWRRTSPFTRLEDPEGWAKAVSNRLLKEGWEGDGRLGLLWIPPFADTGIEDTHGTYVWHVKQRNNGVSWLLSPVPLPFVRLKRQNPWEETMEAQGWLPVSIMETEVNSFLSDIDLHRTQLADQSRVLDEQLPATYRNQLLLDLLAFRQGMMVADFNSFMDSCYLQLLQEVILRGNPYGIKLRKASVRLDPSHYAPAELRPGEETPEFLTLAGVVSDAWRDYSFEDFSTRTDMLFKAVNFAPDPTQNAEIKKHVEIRNCIQHNHSKLSPESLRRLGLKVILVRTSNPGNPIAIGAWQRISLTVEELTTFCDVLTALGDDFKAHVDRHVPSRAYVKPSGD